MIIRCRYSQEPRNSTSMSPGGRNIGIGFAVSINTAKKVMDN
jgi:S1-C subfamily serine protease